MRRVRELLTGMLQHWIRFVQAHRLWVVVSATVLTALALFYTVNNLGMSTSTKELLSSELEWRQLDMEYERQFPQYPDNILAVVEAPTPDQALDAADRLYQRLIREDELFRSVYYPNALTIFKESALLFLSTEELQDLADNLAAIQPFLARLTDDQTLRGLFSMLSEAVTAIEDGEDIDLEPLVRQINRALAAQASGGSYRVSWHRLMSGADDSDPVHRELILLQPRLEEGALLPASKAIGGLRQMERELALGEEIGANLRLTGSTVLEQEELLSVARGTEIALILALCVVTVVMLIGLGSIKLVAASLITLLCGLVLTAAMATLTVGELNLISMAFAVLYIGLGVDFAIHYCLRYRELLFNGVANQRAIQESSLNIGNSLFVCAATTAVGFFAFMPTDYDGVAELGLIAGSGILISLVVTLTLLPALLMLMPLRKRANNSDAVGGLTVKILDFPVRHARAVRIGSVIVVIALFAVLGKMRFDHNTLNLQDQGNESVQTFRDLLADSDTSPWVGNILAGSRTEAEQMVREFERLHEVDRTVWLGDFIPEDQEEKLWIIEDMILLLGPVPDQSEAPPISDAERLRALRDFQQQLSDSVIVGTRPEFLKLQHLLRDFLDRAATQRPAEVHAALENLATSMLASLPGRLETLRASLDADYITLDTLPEDLIERRLSPDGRYLIDIYPRENIQDNDAMRRFVEAMQSVDQRVIGAPIVNLEASDAVMRSFREAFMYAFAVIALVLVFLLHRKRDVFYILVPLAMAAVLTGGASVLLDIPVNFANIIALPLLLGIGVDSGIHILHRFRTTNTPDSNPLRTSSARAVVVSALTTVGGIGNLAFSPHAGTASMGKVLALGITMTLICTLIVLPSLLAAQAHRKGGQ